jgi:hypothetical protein
VAAENEQVELRGLISRRVADVLDAVALARDTSRMEVVASILKDWAEKKSHEATVITRVLKKNGCNSDGNGGGK